MVYWIGLSKWEFLSVTHLHLRDTGWRCSRASAWSSYFYRHLSTIRPRASGTWRAVPTYLAPRLDAARPMLFFACVANQQSQKHGNPVGWSHLFESMDGVYICLVPRNCDPALQADSRCWDVGHHICDRMCAGSSSGALKPRWHCRWVVSALVCDSRVNGCGLHYK